MNERFSRQSFLGINSQAIISACRFGIVGLGGGGSHVVQQLAHLGAQNYVLLDPDHVEDSNLNRLVGATVADVGAKTLKVDVAERTIKGLNSNADIRKYPDRWQKTPVAIRECDIIFSCIDGLAERRDLESECRRWLVPMIDIGVTVTPSDAGPPYLSGQAILSMPGHPCMKCLSFLTEEAIAKEVLDYGGAGPRPQVVWPNGVLASTAVGLAIDLITDWTKSLRGPVYIEYRGNHYTLQPHHRGRIAVPKTCVHYPLTQAGSIRTKPIA